MARAGAAKHARESRPVNFSGSDQTADEAHGPEAHATHANPMGSVTHASSESGGGAPEVETSRVTPGVETPRGSPEVETSHVTPGVEVSRRSPEVETSHVTPGVEASRGSPGVEAFRVPPELEASLVSPEAAGRAFEALTAVVQQCQRERRPLWSPLALQPPAPAGVVVADYAALGGVVAYAREDLTITVQAGRRLTQLESDLAVCGQEAPLDLPQVSQLTVLDLIAANLFGPRRWGRGTVRDALLGVTVIGAGGDRYRGGGRVVKNVAGYDLCKLFTGSHGWLGLIVAATLRVVPRPDSAQAVALAFADAAAAEAELAALLRGPLRPVAIDLLSPAAARRLRIPDPHALLLLVGFEGLREEVHAQVGMLLAQPRTGEVAAMLDDEAFRRYCSAAAAVALASPRFARVSLPGAAVAAFIARFGGEADGLALVAHAGDGVVWIAAPADGAATLREACRAAANLGGNWSAGGIVDPEWPRIGPPAADWELMRRVKAALDPCGVFARGSPFDSALTVDAALGG